VWKDVVGYEGIYQVSDTGSIKRIKGGQGAQPNTILSQMPDNGNYLMVCLYRNGKRTRKRVHTIVAETFVGPRPSNKHEVLHLDGCKTNNNSRNLAWGTRSDNMQDAIRHGTATTGSKNAQAKFSVEQVKNILLAIVDGETVTSISKRLGVSHSIISEIKSGKTYKEVERQ